MVQFDETQRYDPYETAPPTRTDVLCYDTETSDADVRNGQVFQFAAVLADAALVPVGEHDVRIRRLPYVVPSVEALKVTGFDPADLDDPRRPTEYAATSTIEQIMREPPGTERIFLSFHGIKFDDELLRTTMFRNLRKPWLTSGANRTRVDVLALARLAAALAPEALRVPLNPENGKRVWRLQALCEANGIPIRAHDALGDARATLTLAALIRARAPRAWDVAVDGGNPARLARRLKTALGERAVVHVFTHFHQAEATPCLVLGEDGRGHWLVADLAYASGRQKSPTAWPAPLATGKGAPFRVVRAKAAPYLVDAATARSVSPHDPAAVAAAAEAWIAAPARIAAALDAYANSPYTGGAADPTSEERIYDSFPCRADESAMRGFHAAPDWAARAAIRFRDDRLADFAARLVLNNASAAELAAVGPKTKESLERACHDALRRPYAPPDSRWATLSRETGRADDAWKAWSDVAFDRPVQGDLFEFH